MFQTFKIVSNHDAAGMQRLELRQNAKFIQFLLELIYFDMINTNTGWVDYCPASQMDFKYRFLSNANRASGFAPATREMVIVVHHAMGPYMFFGRRHADLVEARIMHSDTTVRQMFAALNLMEEKEAFDGGSALIYWEPEKEIKWQTITNISNDQFLIKNFFFETSYRGNMGKAIYDLHSAVAAKNVERLKESTRILNELLADSTRL